MHEYIKYNKGFGNSVLMNYCVINYHYLLVKSLSPSDERNHQSNCDLVRYLDRSNSADLSNKLFGTAMKTGGTTIAVVCRPSGCPSLQKMPRMGVNERAPWRVRSLYKRLLFRGRTNRLSSGLLLFPRGPRLPLGCAVGHPVTVLPATLQQLPPSNRQSDHVLRRCKTLGVPEVWVNDTASHFKNHVMKTLEGACRWNTGLHGLIRPGQTVFLTG